MSSISTRHHMPPRGEEGTPVFDRSNPRSLLQYLSELKILFIQCSVTHDQEKKEHAIRYLDFDTWELWQCLPEFSDPSSSFYDFILSLYDLYPDCLDSERYSFAELEKFVRKTFSAGIHSLSDLGEYHRHFITTSTALIKSHLLSDLEEKRFYIQGFQTLLQAQILDRLQLKHLDRLPDIPYDVQEVYSSAKFILLSNSCSTSSQSSQTPIVSLDSLAPSFSKSLPTSPSSSASNPPISSYLPSIPRSPLEVSGSRSILHSDKHGLAPIVNQFTSAIVQSVQSSPGASHIVSASHDSSNVLRHPSIAPTSPTPLRITKGSAHDVENKILLSDRLKRLEDEVHSIKAIEEHKFLRSRTAFVQGLQLKSQQSFIDRSHPSMPPETNSPPSTLKPTHILLLQMIPDVVRRIPSFNAPPSSSGLELAATTSLSSQEMSYSIPSSLSIISTPDTSPDLAQRSPSPSPSSNSFIRCPKLPDSSLVIINQSSSSTVAPNARSNNFTLPTSIICASPLLFDSYSYTQHYKPPALIFNFVSSMFSFLYSIFSIFILIFEHSCYSAARCADSPFSLSISVVPSRFLLRKAR